MHIDYHFTNGVLETFTIDLVKELDHESTRAQTIRISGRIEFITENKIETYEYLTNKYENNKIEMHTLAPCSTIPVSLTSVNWAIINIKKMKNNSLLLLLVIFLTAFHASHAQFNPIKSFDYSLLEGKKLYIPTFGASSSYIKKMGRRGKLDEITDAKAKAAHYNKIWKEAMAESSYDATDYEIRAFDPAKMIKAKNKEALLLSYISTGYGNWKAVLMVTSPKRQMVGQAIITGLDLGDKNDIRLMMNMLNESITTATELEESGDKSWKSMKNNGKEQMISFYNTIGEKTFLVPKSNHKNPKKAADRTNDLKLALKSWKLSKYQLTTSSDIEKRRLAGDEDSFYWRDFPIYTQNPLITYHFNLILSTQSDDILFAFLGKKRLKPATIEKMQNKIKSKTEKYKKQLND